MPYNRNTAFHEAGHVVAHCHFGHGIHSAHVLPAGVREFVDRKSRLVTGICGHLQACMNYNDHLGLPEGFTAADLIRVVPEDTREEYRQANRNRAMRDIICTYAGSYAEARVRRVSAVVALLRGGGGDLEAVEAVARFVALDAADHLKLKNSCERIVQKFLRGPGRWKEVEAVAAVLMREGVIEGDNPLLESMGPRYRPLHGETPAVG